MPFSVAEFVRLAGEAGRKTYFWSGSSLDPIVKQLERGDPGFAVIHRMKQLPRGKAEKYARALEYFAFNYPDVGTRGFVSPHGGHIAGKDWTFQEMYYGDHSDDPYLHGDVVYGTSSGRSLPPYRPPEGRRRMRFMDDYNNAANIGTGLIFNATWDGSGLAPMSGDEMRQLAYRRYEQSGSEEEGERFRNGRFQAYLDGMFGSRYSPSEVLNIPESRLRRHDWRKPDVGPVAALAQARLVRGVRRACKGGIAMIATSPEFANARVHFVLDKLGDMGRMARKEHTVRGGTYLPITSSEMCFVCRYWEQLKDKVYFWVNGRRVQPPWNYDWSLADAEGNMVSSSQETWLRYALYRILAQKSGVMPSWATD